MHDQDTYARTRSPAEPAPYVGTDQSAGTGSGESKVSAAAQTAKDTAKDEAANVAQTAKREAGAVVDQAKGQVRRLASEARDQATTRVRGQHEQLVDRLRTFADELGEMGGDGNSPARAVVSDLSQRGRRVADYLADRGPEGILAEVQDFARRRPMAFLLGAVAAGFMVGRLGKGVWKAQSESGSMGSSYRSSDRVDMATVVGSEPVVAPIETTPGMATGAPQWTEPPVTTDVPPAGTVPGAMPPAGPPPGAPSPYASETYGTGTTYTSENYGEDQAYPGQGGDRR